MDCLHRHAHASHPGCRGARWRERLLPLAIMLGVSPMAIGEVEVMGGTSAEDISALLGQILGTGVCPDCGERHRV